MISSSTIYCKKHMWFIPHQNTQCSRAPNSAGFAQLVYALKHSSHIRFILLKQKQHCLTCDGLSYFAIDM